MRSLLSYYSATGNLNPEGDVHINEPIQGLGTDQHSFTNSLLERTSPPQPASPFSSCSPQTTLSDISVTQLARDPHLENMYRLHTDDPMFLPDGFSLEWIPLPWNVSLWLYYRYIEDILTESTPHLGYFLAGGMAGVVSRTATAPFDRLKVYLIAQTKSQSATANIAKSGNVIEAAGWMAGPLVQAVKDLWRAGGIRSLFAGA